MLDKNGNKISVGDQVITITRKTLVIAQLSHVTKSSFVFNIAGGGSVRFPRYTRGIYVGYDEIEAETGNPWIGISYETSWRKSSPGDSISKGYTHKIIPKGDRNTNYKWDDITADKNPAILKVTQEFIDKFNG